MEYIKSILIELNYLYCYLTGRFDTGNLITLPDESTRKIYIGSYFTAQDNDWLKQNKITHIINLIGTGRKFSGIQYLSFTDVYDDQNQDITRIFDQCFNFIESGTNIYIHCHAGISRSATIVIMYLMKKYNLNYDEAFGLVKTARPCIQPNEGFEKQLRGI